VCGRYALYGPRKRSREQMEYFESIGHFPPRWNVALTDTMPICRLVDGKPELVAAKWGLIPGRATDPRIGGKKINAPCQNVLTNYVSGSEGYVVTHASVRALLRVQFLSRGLGRC
jgi:putative SOS response-associated peptidase YedK